jgi:hypothetical protein
MDRLLAPTAGPTDVFLLQLVRVQAQVSLKGILGLIV